MLIKIGFDIALDVKTASAVLFSLRVHPSRERDLLTPEDLRVEPGIPVSRYRDVFGNRCGRVAVEAGLVRFTNSAMIRDSGKLNPINPGAAYHDVRDLPLNALPFIQGTTPAASA